MDRDMPSFNKYFSAMPWAAVPFGTQIPQNMMQKFGVRGIPSLFICNKNGDIISRDGTQDLSSHKFDMNAAKKMWMGEAPNPNAVGASSASSSVPAPKHAAAPAAPAPAPKPAVNLNWPSAVKPKEES